MSQSTATASGAPTQPKPGQYRVMVVDDSAVIRGLVTRWLQSDPGIVVVASASNGVVALSALDKAEVDVVILDIEMPEMDGMTALPRLLERDPGLKIIMSSTLTRDGADVTVRALGMGAADYIPKPTSRSELHSSSDYRGQLIEKVKALGSARRQRRDSTAARAAAPAAAPGLFRGRTISLRRYPAVFNPAVVAIGSSTGGPQALLKVFEVLGTKVRLPIFITQHMPATFTTILAEHLSRDSGARVAEGVDGEPVEGNRVYLAPGDFHMTVASEAGKKIIRLNQQPPENFCRPAVDVMLRSMVEVYGGSILSVILTGMGYDGLKSSEGLVEAGGVLLAQDEDTSVVWGMPGAVATQGLCNAVLALGSVGNAMLRVLDGGRP